MSWSDYFSHQARKVKNFLFSPDVSSMTDAQFDRHQASLFRYEDDSVSPRSRFKLSLTPEELETEAKTLLTGQMKPVYESFGNSSKENLPTYRLGPHLSENFELRDYTRCLIAKDRLSQTLEETNHPTLRGLALTGQCLPGKSDNTLYLARVRD